MRDNYPILSLTPEARSYVRRQIPAVLTNFEFNRIEEAFAEAFTDQQIVDDANRILFSQGEDFLWDAELISQSTRHLISSDWFHVGDILELGKTDRGFLVVCFDQGTAVLYDGHSCWDLDTFVDMLNKVCPNISIFHLTRAN